MSTQSNPPVRSTTTGTLPAPIATAPAQRSSSNVPTPLATNAQTTTAFSQSRIAFPSGPKPATVTQKFSPAAFQNIKIGYVAIQTPVPKPWHDYFNVAVFPRLDTHVRNIVVNKYGKEDIMRVIRYRMFGKKHSGKLDLNSTILIGCTSRKCEKYLRKTFSGNELAYLKRFDQPWRIYLEDVKFGALSRREDTASQPSNENTRSSPRLEIERTSIGKFFSGMMVKFVDNTLSAGDSHTTRYSMIGGAVFLGEQAYGLATGHLFAADAALLESDGSSSEDDCSAQDSGSSSIKSDAGFEVPQQYHPAHSREFVPLVLSASESWTYSFMDQRKPLGPLHLRPSGFDSDWALIQLPTQPAFENVYTVDGKDIVISSILPQYEVSPGPVYVLCSGNGLLNGFLIPGTSYMQSMSATLTVMEIAMDDSLPYGYSGSWVVRGNKLLGHLIASSSSGRHCFMLPIEQIFSDITYTTGMTPHLTTQPDTTLQDCKRPAKAWRRHKRHLSFNTDFDATVAFAVEACRERKRHSFFDTHFAVSIATTMASIIAMAIAIAIATVIAAPPH